MDIWNHHMDAIRYAIASGEKKPVFKQIDPGGVMPYYEGIPA